jgi:hypothetical protein
MRITSPASKASFDISNLPEWPSIVFKTDKAPGSGQQLFWEWKIAWKTFSKTGNAITITDSWDAKTAITDFGGELTVKVTLRQALPGTPAASPATGAIAGAVSGAASGRMAGQSVPSGVAGANRPPPPEVSVPIIVKVKGVQTTDALITSYLATKSNASGFDKILRHESKMAHYTNTGEPKKSFDNGYGLCQLTSPTPTYEQVWNWKKNIDAGLLLFEQKRTAAKNYLGQSNRTYTDDQLLRETVCRWNGGSYHSWNATTMVWERNANILCATGTQNIGWDMTSADNNGKTEAELKKRDSGEYLKRGRKDGDKWKYSGVCYADSLLAP